MTQYKVKFKRYILNVYLPKKDSGQRVVLLPGLPMSANIDNLIKTFHESGAVVFYPYFSGSYDSGNRFSASQCIKDAAALWELAQHRELTELYFNKKLKLNATKEIILAGISYGAAISLLGHKNLYQKIILLSPALLFRPQDIRPTGDGFTKQMKSLLKLLKNAHPFTYRLSATNDLEEFLCGKSKLTRRKNVVRMLNDIKGPVLILHGTGDTSIPSSVTQSLEREVTNDNVVWHYINAKHSASSYSPDSLRIIRRFLESDLNTVT